MSIPDRVFRLSKSYLNQVRDRIDAELSDAERELNADSTTSPGGIDAPDEERRARLYRDNDPEAMIRRAEARIAAARREVESRGRDEGSGGTAPQTPVAAPVTTGADSPRRRRRKTRRQARKRKAATRTITTIAFWAFPSGAIWRRYSPSTRNCRAVWTPRGSVSPKARPSRSRLRRS